MQNLTNCSGASVLSYSAMNAACDAGEISAEASALAAVPANTIAVASIGANKRFISFPRHSCGDAGTGVAQSYLAWIVALDKIESNRRSATSAPPDWLIGDEVVGVVATALNSWG